MIARPEGIILVTGPTGSGKTTTLYSILNHINSDGVNIMTLEDPVEYPMTLIRQTSVAEAAKLDFANGIRAMMRQDPDVILVGEIRDQETAEMAFRAAMTGHQVYSTLHTNSVDRRDPAPAGHRHAARHHGGQHHRHHRAAPGAQALPHCRQSYDPDVDDAAPARHGADRARARSTSAVGCEQCDNQGYRGPRRRSWRSSRSTPRSTS